METIFKVETHHKKHSAAKALLFALVIITAGVIYLLKNLGIISGYTWDIIISWPMLVAVIGFLNLSGRTFFFGLILLLFGGFFLAARYYGLDINFSKVFWPSLMILGGLVIIWFSFHIFKGKGFIKSSSKQDFIEEISVFGGSEKTIISENFQGGKIINIFGGSKLDFSKSKLAEGTHNMEFVNVFGGSTLIIPADWNVKTEIASIFGGFVDKRPPCPSDSNKILHIKGVAIFGGGEIKSL